MNKFWDNIDSLLYNEYLRRKLMYRFKQQLKKDRIAKQVKYN